MPICLLVRHGHSTANADGVLSGRAPGVGLTDRGRAEVGALGAALAGVPLVRVVSSPLERCLATAAAVAEGHDLDVEQDDRVIECAYGAWTGRPLRELTADPLWRVVQDTPSRARFPESDAYAGESLAEMAQRAVGALTALDAEVEAGHGPDAVWAVVSHGDVLKAVLAHVAGTALDDFQRLVVEPASVAVVRLTPDRPFLLGLNTDPARVGAMVAALAGQGSDATPGGSTGATAADPR